MEYIIVNPLLLGLAALSVTDAALALTIAITGTRTQRGTVITWQMQATGVAQRTRLPR
ncbi:MAG: hypothetical protein F2894_03195 [Actinobacteria bacterium]|nr:hypothetical protein [Actinomycetota bacterium]MSX33052.1 hypothetical protein [Actinomycetota bacterium]